MPFCASRGTQPGKRRCWSGLVSRRTTAATRAAPCRARRLCGAAGLGSRGLYVCSSSQVSVSVRRCWPWRPRLDVCSFSQGSVCMRRCCWPWQWLSLRVQLLAGRGRCAALLLAIEFFLRYAHFRHAGPNGYLAGCWDWRGAAGGPSQCTHSFPWLPKSFA